MIAEPTRIAQFYANIASSGVNMIEASAGTGKTYSILRIYLKYLLEQWSQGNWVKYDQVLLVTFTNAATYELKSRLLEFLTECYEVVQDPQKMTDSDIRGIIEPYLNSASIDDQKLIELLDEFLSNFDQVPVHTIHGFCGKVQQEWFGKAGISVIQRSRVEAVELLEEACKDYWRYWMHKDEGNHAFAALLKDRYDRPVGGDSFNSKSLLKSLKGIEGSLNPTFNQSNSRNGSVQEKLEQAKSAFHRTVQNLGNLDAFAAEIAHDFDYLEYDKKNGPGWSKRIGNYFKAESSYLNIDKKTKELLQRAGSDAIEQKVKTKKKHDYQLKSWSTYIDEYLADIDDLEITEEELLAYIASEIHHQITKKCKNEALSTHDLDLKYTLQALLDSPKLCQDLGTHFRCILVDEFQDTDAIQYRLFQKIHSSGKDPSSKALYLIGDPKQSIYRFRSADIRTYLDAKREAENLYTLDTNFRSSEVAVKAINELFSQPKRNGKEAFDYPEIPFEKVNAKHKNFKLESTNPTIFPVEGLRLVHPIIETEEKDEQLKSDGALEFIAKEIHAMLVSDILQIPADEKDPEKGSRKLEAKDIAVIVKKHKHAQQLRDLLAERNIPAVLYDRPSVFLSDEARWLTYLLDAILNFRSQAKIRRGLTTPFFDIPLSQMVQMSEESNIEELMTPIIQQLSEWEERWKARGVMDLLQSILQQKDIRARIVGLTNGDRSLTNLLQLCDLLHQYEHQTKCTPLRLVEYLQLKRQRAAENKEKDEDDEVKLDTDEDLVKIMTLFRSKGLEFNLVFSALSFFVDSQYLNDKLQVELLNESKSKIQENWVIGKNRLVEDGLTLHNFDRREAAREAIRQVYVALTRAKYQTIFIDYKSMNKGDGPIVPSFLINSKNESTDYKHLYSTPEEYKAYLNQNAEKLNHIHIEGADDQADRIAEFEDVPFLDTERDANTSTFEDAVINWPHEHINSSWTTGSYSALNKRIPAVQMSADDEEGEENDSDSSPTQKQQSPKSLFDFPKGANPGSFMHQILEDLDFTNVPDSSYVEEVISDNCTRFGFEFSKWKDILIKMVHRTLNQTINFDGTIIQLSQLQPHSLQKELEFLFDHAPYELQSLLNVIPRDKGSKPITSTQLQGFMKGFIDLTFIHDGKIYLLDYKSNHLGDRFEDYSSDAIEKDLLKHGYDIQYHIYAYAAHRIMQNRILEYDYNKHFGGVCYLYLRGLKEDGHTGVFTTTQPDHKTIQQLDTVFGRFQDA